MDEDLWAAYDRMGPSFQEHAADSAFNTHYDRPAVLAALGPVTGRRVLDAACGPGLYLRELLERGATVSAFDASPVMVALARQLTANHVRIEQAVLGEPLPYPDCAFDLIVWALAIHYARNRAAAFAEFCRVLRPGGAAVVSTQHPVMDWLRKNGSYFQTTLETDIWPSPSRETEQGTGISDLAPSQASRAECRHSELTQRRGLRTSGEERATIAHLAR
jgi:SAM-dependent methyltransferase